MGNSKSSSRQSDENVAANRVQSPVHVHTQRLQEGLDESYQDVRIISPHYQQSGVHSVLEHVQKSKEDRLQASSQSRSQRRAAQLEHRRASSTSPETVQVQKPNPMSYAKAAFSVEPQHHKRSYAAGSMDEDEPDGKRLRRAAESETWNPAAVATLVAAVATAVGLALQYFKRK